MALSHLDSPNPTADIFIAICFGACTLFGLPANIASLSYFISQPRKLFNLLYRMISMNDIFVTTFAFPVMLSMATRQEMMFGSHVVCTVWGMFWKVFSYLSVCLVGVMSISRTYILIYPLGRINKRNLLTCVVCYIVFLILYRSIPFLVGVAKFIFTTEDCHCWDSSLDIEIGGINIEIIDSSITFLLLSVPLFPITISCAISIYCLNRELNQPLGNARR